MMMITGAQRRRDLPRGTRSRAREQSTQHWWKISPKLHLVMIKMMRMITVMEVMTRMMMTQHWWKINPKLHLRMIFMMVMMTITTKAIITITASTPCAPV